MKLTFLNEPEDIRWARDTVLRGVAVVPMFQSALLKGNEDCPAVVELYARKHPTIHDDPVTVFRRQGSELIN